MTPIFQKQNGLQIFPCNRMSFFQYASTHTIKISLHIVYPIYPPGSIYLFTILHGQDSPLIKLQLPRSNAQDCRGWKMYCHNLWNYRWESEAILRTAPVPGDILDGAVSAGTGGMQCLYCWALIPHVCQRGRVFWERGLWLRTTELWGTALSRC